MLEKFHEPGLYYLSARLPSCVAYAYIYILYVVVLFATESLDFNIYLQHYLPPVEWPAPPGDFKKHRLLFRAAPELTAEAGQTWAQTLSLSLYIYICMCIYIYIYIHS